MNSPDKRLSSSSIKRLRTDFGDVNPAQIKIIRATPNPNIVRFPPNQNINDVSVSESSSVQNQRQPQQRQIVFDHDNGGNLIINDQQSGNAKLSTSSDFGGQNSSNRKVFSSYCGSARNLSSGLETGAHSDRMICVNRGSKTEPRVTVGSIIDKVQHHDSHQQGTSSSSNFKQDRQSSPVRILGEQERFLPMANIGRIMKHYIPDNGKVAKDAKECMQECISEFISFITSEASERCREEKRKTISGEDILCKIMIFGNLHIYAIMEEKRASLVVIIDAMETLGLEPFVEPLKSYLQKYRMAYKGDKMQMGDFEFDDGTIVYPEMDDSVELLDSTSDQDQNENDNISDRTVVSLTNEQLNALLQSGQLVLTPVNVSSPPQQQQQNQGHTSSDTVVLTQQESIPQQIPVLYLDQSSAQQQQNSSITDAAAFAGFIPI
uniref:Transcription factor CBF/NF-Y/archaeal histone domain-containing protein n=1 Tax=Romanomermis culicivorax TaxID=13658 RepID=A0A915JE70_ROMCU